MEHLSPVVDPDDIESVLTDEVSRLAPGTRLATERDLMERFSAPRSMIRKVLSSMEARFLISREFGSGTYVTDRATMTVGNAIAPSFHAAIAASGKLPETRLVCSSRVALPQFPAEVLGVAPGAEALFLERVGYIDSLPATVVREWVVPERLYDLDTALGVIESVNESLVAFGFNPVRRRTLASVTDTPPEVRATLGQRRPTLCWKLVTASEDKDSGAPLMVSETHMRMDLIDLCFDFR